MKYKVANSKIKGAGKGLFVKQNFREGETIGIAHVNDKPTKIVGSYHNHSEDPTAGSITVGNKRYIVALRDLKPGEEITTDYRQQPELEQPENFMRKGGMITMPKDKPEKSKKFSRSLDATNRLFTENKVFAKPKSKKRKVFDPYAKYYAEGGITEDMSAVVNPQDLDPATLKKYLNELKALENSVKAGYKKGKWYPHKSFEGGNDTIAYGHKLISGEDYSSGISDKKASELQKRDVLEKQKVAQNFVDKKYGEGTYDGLPQNSQMLLLDYTYNGVINKFPSFVKHVVEGNKEGMLKEYERGSKGSPLKARNEWTKNVINSTDFEEPKKISDSVIGDALLNVMPLYRDGVLKMPPFANGGEYGMPLGTGASQNYLGRTKYKHKVGGIPNLPLRDNRINYNNAVNSFEPMTKRQDGGYVNDFIELDLTPEEIDQYKKGGWVVEYVD